MQGITQGIIEELQSLLENAKQMETRYLSEILALEKIVNRTQKCLPVVAARENNKEQVKMQKNDNLQVSIEEKVRAMMEDVEIRQKNIENEKNDTKPKYQVKPPEVVIEKKPPLPTVNRNERALKNQVPAYVPPRNRNEVTGKVTQTNFRTSGQKVFRPEKSLKKVQSKEQVKVKEKGSAQKKVEKKVESVKKDTQQEVTSKQSSSLPAIHRVNNEKQPQKKPEPMVTHPSVPAKFASFHKQVQQILGEVLGQGPKNHKKQLEKLLAECESQQKSHRMHEQTNRRLFIKKANNYAVTKQAIEPMTSYEITRNKWSYRPDLENMHFLLDGLINQLENLQLQKDCRIDKKTQFRISQSALIYSQVIQQMREDSERANTEVPEKLDLSFSFTEQLSAKSQDETADLQQLSQINLNDQLLQLLEEISEKGSLEKNQLRGLQVLAEIGMFRSKRTPMIVMQKEYTSWKEHYADVIQP